MPGGIDVPPPKNEFVEAFIFQANLVELRIVKKSLFGVLPIIDSVPTNGHTCEHQIISVIHQKIIELCSRKCTEHAKEEDWKHEHYVLVEHIKY